uniref:Uncharacterized protein n=1 Tax=Heterorhabditis bacteriophora TaxID=37862 RepID=A0A1I7WIS4_HETBA
MDSYITNNKQILGLGKLIFCFEFTLNFDYNVIVNLGLFAHTDITFRWLNIVVPNLIHNRIANLQPNYDIQKLFNLMEDNPVNFKYMKDRIGLLWPTWTNALTYNFSKYPSSMKYRKRLNVC